MRLLALLFVTGLALPTQSYAQAEEHRLQMSLADQFVVQDTDDWKVTVQKEMPLRLANVAVKPKTGHGFSLMLYFKCDTPDLAQFDSIEKIEAGLVSSSKKYLSNSVEKKVVVKRLEVKGWYGASTVLTDKETAEKKEVPEGEFKYIVRGMVRLSPDSVLGFSLMTNDLNSREYKAVMDYIFGFVKEKK